MNTAEVPVLNPAPIPGRIIAEFASARDARLFAAIKRECGELVTITAGVYHLFAVRQLVSV